MIYPEELVTLGFSIAPDGLPVWIKPPLANISLMWCTGQKTTDGTLLYEGDICEMGVINEFKSAVKGHSIMRWHSPTSQFILQMPAEKGNQFFNTVDIFLLGNEFENPELIPLITPKPKEKLNG